MLAKQRVVGSPLSDAEHKQRVDAARARWEGIGAGIATAAGAAAGELGRRKLQGRALADAKGLRAGLNQELGAARQHAQARITTIARLERKAKKSIGGVGAKTEGPFVDLKTTPRPQVAAAARKVGWPVPEYYRFIERAHRGQPEGLTLKPGESIPQAAILDRLRRDGLTPSSAHSVAAIQPNEFRVRGDDIIVRPRVGAPYRISQFGDHIDKLETINLRTLKANGKLATKRMGAPANWSEYVADMKTPHRVLREGAPATRRTASWVMKAKETPQQALMRWLTPPDRIAFFELTEQAKDRGQKPPKVEAYIKDRFGSLPRVTRRTKDKTAKGNVGDVNERRMTSQRVQGTPNDTGLDAMRHTLLQDLRPRVQRMRVATHNRLVNATAQARHDLAPRFAAAKASFARFSPKARFAVFGGLAGAAAAVGISQLGKLAPSEIDAAAREAKAPSSPEHAEAGTYRKGHMSLHGMRIAIETPRGAWRRGRDRAGKPWKVKLPAHYGYVKGSMGFDGDQVDVYLGPDAHDPDCRVFVVDQFKPEGGFDEHKGVLGARTREAAMAIYDGGFSDGSGPKRRRGIVRLTLPEFKEWVMGTIKGPIAKEPMAKELAKAAPEDDEKPEEITVPDTEAAEAALSRRLARLFRGWVDKPNKLPDDEDIADALTPISRLFMKAATASGGPPSGNAVSAPADEGPIPRELAVNFDTRNPRIEQGLKDYEFNLIRQISDDARASIRTALVQGAQSGLPIPQQARQFRETIGLTSEQSNWVRSYRAQLETNDPRVLERALRDRRFDGPVRKAQAGEKPLTAEQIDRFVTAYHRRTLAYRATTIARTEAIRAANEGTVFGIRETLADNPTFTVEKTWMTTRDGHERDSHRDLHNRMVTGIDTAFMTTTGASIRYPHDPQAPAKETIQCRCQVGYRIIPRPAGLMTAV